ncbi:DNA repair protein RadA [Candidatus Gottesmanbacteria bacterium RIFCSPHIGHO2_02_FULL_40_24]|uniref:DNA repair protein RadA n=1 Tax=Candidatus Gottesmanbacteria bacterium RIFCSPHIGHO2_01_FULL_40_15 TaxID=1798376 RepID=A0A1F5Z422_9BACT|nr:MAG: DNA repair protein RadA [Candidatus Gottesmanbacteria bacterium RIFCSPHIGHO2_01_FULL_40_15]OGG18591.1 MAG: DNA repair protein RadA [Candidatus Gottesmanbacteria bacterium RIFCSPHIGHO2_02_FULL_40_24]OGG25915.1 MAG: DNA repair protein RadA [Candidatus Gottesmanbacteria bacterium RIFCSPHIGHO2_12_FULL_40_13]OGG33852.1 MAG: DNA repair protein RadA [Candidatus Gottesmanbacteria bacterium RIFCSPLOWO2_02_FULL_40_10]
MKTRSQFVCQQCGYKSPSFLGRCPNCDSWNSLVETVEADKITPWAKVNRRERKAGAKLFKLSQVKSADFKRISSGIGEADQVLGTSTGSVQAGNSLAGFVPGSVVLLAGDPGIGKSTLALQILANIGGLYISGEESQEQVSLRASRLKIATHNIFILNETNIEAIIESYDPNNEGVRLIVIDSIQTVWSQELTGAPGSVGQVRECALRLLDLAKSKNIPIILIGHVTKEGTIAGPRILEHIVDTVLYLEGERFQSLRILRSSKNRYGAVDEVGVFSMEEKGMTEVSNPSELFLGEQPSYAKASAGKAGSVIVATMEGSRPLLVEIQALTVSTQMPIARRVGTGINSNRLQMLVAILQKHLRLPLGNFDIFVNAASGIKVFEPAADLGICLAIVTSFKNKPLPAKTAALGEVGLLGEIRNVIGLERRIKEAKKLGFTNIISAKNYHHISRITADLF